MSISHAKTPVRRSLWHKFLEFADPIRFLGWSQKVLPWLLALTVCLLLIGFYGSFFAAPADYQMGETVRIMFIHVPAAWLSMFIFAMMAVSSFSSLVWRHPLADISAKSAAPLGAAFTLIALLTGSFWGKPMWGTWWEWDARLTSVLILFIMYCGLIALWTTIEDHIAAGRAAAVITLVGSINLPIIKFSVDWWNTLHQPASVIRMDGPTIHISMLWPLLVMAIASTFLFFTLHMMAMRNEVLRRRIKARRLAEIDRGEWKG